jgi:transposase-like protein
MLTEQQLKAVELVLEGEKTVTAIAKECGVSRPTMYSWMNKDEFKEKLSALDDLRDEFLRKAIKSRVEVYKERLEALSEKSPNDMVKLNATKELMSHAGWNSNVQDINIKDDRQQDNTNDMLDMYRKKKAGGSL